MNPPPQRLYAPRPALIETGPDGAPTAVESVAVESIREEWLVEDRWWTPKPLKRHYFEVVLADGRDVVVFQAGSRWFLQRA
jgi:hypothetical protein